MRTIVDHEHGRPEDVLRTETVAEPGAPGPGEVRVRVLLRPVHHGDLLGIWGRYAPGEALPPEGIRVGFEGYGQIEAVGPGVALEPGARVAFSWRMDETYIKVKGRWTYLDRAVDRDGQTLDLMLSAWRDLAAARRFFRRAISGNGVPERVVVDKSGANLAGLQAVNAILKFTDSGRMIEVRQAKYLNNILEQSRRFVKQITGPMMGFKAFHSAEATIAALRRLT